MKLQMHMYGWVTNSLPPRPESDVILSGYIALLSDNCGYLRILHELPPLYGNCLN